MTEAQALITLCSSENQRDISISIRTLCTSENQRDISISIRTLCTSENRCDIRILCTGENHSTEAEAEEGNVSFFFCLRCDKQKRQANQNAHFQA